MSAERVIANLLRIAREDLEGARLLNARGNRNAIYTQPPAPAVIVHDWIWRRRGTSRIVSLALLKRINLVRST